MRVIAGTARGIKLIAPEGVDTRPTLDRTKETLFNMIFLRIENCIFLDVFSGSGAIGIESLSRGGKKAYFIENANNALKCIKQNLIKTNLMDKAEVLGLNYIQAFKTLKGKNLKFDIIFIDPPFNKDYEDKVITDIFLSEFLADDGLIICESSSNTSFEFVTKFKDYKISKIKSFKTSKFIFIEKIKKEHL